MVNKNWHTCSENRTPSYTRIISLEFFLFLFIKKIRQNIRRKEYKSNMKILFCSKRPRFLISSCQPLDKVQHWDLHNFVPCEFYVNASPWNLKKGIAWRLEVGPPRTTVLVTCYCCVLRSWLLFFFGRGRLYHTEGTLINNLIIKDKYILYFLIMDSPRFKLFN